MITDFADLPTKLREWLKQPGARIGPAELKFIADMRAAAAAGVGYGFMQQIIEWEWQDQGIGAWGPESHAKELRARNMKCFLWKDGPDTYGDTFMAIAADVDHARHVMLDELERQGCSEEAAPYSRNMIRTVEPKVIDLPTAFYFGGR